MSDRSDRSARPRPAEDVLAAADGNEAVDEVHSGTFTIARQPGIPDDAWEKGQRGMDEGLAVLRRIVEAAS